MYFDYSTIKYFFMFHHIRRVTLAYLEAFHVVLNINVPYNITTA